MVSRLTPEFARASKVLAANQGLYNGFLAASLIWGFTSAKPVSSSLLPALRRRRRHLRQRRRAVKSCSSRQCRQRWR
ncbi:DUF1304 domain-containing protein [Mesorhizobium sp. M0859]